MICKWAGTHIQTSGSNVSADQGSLLGIAELKECVGPLLLLLLAVEFKHRQVDVVEQLSMVLHTVTAGEEDNDLLLKVALEEGEKKQEALVSLTDDITLFQTLDCAVLLAVVDVDVQGARAQRYARQILDFRGLGGREQHGLSLFGGQDLDNLTHFVLETDFQNTVRLVCIDVRVHSPVVFVIRPHLPITRVFRFLNTKPGVFCR